MVPYFLSTPLLRSAVLPFGTVGLLYGSWAARIPEIQAQTGLNEAQLGGALLGLALGLVLSASATGGLVAKHGAHRIALLGLAVIGVSQAGPGLADSLGLLTGAFVLIGLASGVVDVSMNAWAVEVETRGGRPILGACHGVFSLGGMLGAGLGAAMAALGVSLFAHFATAGVVCASLTLAQGWRVRQREPDTATQTVTASGRPTFTLPRGPVAGLAALSFCGLIVEGAMGDWSALFLQDVHGASASLAALGFGVFMGCMATARFAADALTARFGDRRLVWVGTLLGAVGLVLCLVAPVWPLAVVGFGLVGLGFAGVVPSLFRAAGRVPGLAGGVGIAAVTSVGYMGFMLGPPLLGFVAEATSLRVSFAILVVLAVAMALGSGWAFRRAAVRAEHTGDPDVMPHDEDRAGNAASIAA
ncbi:MAG: MFS transporter [Bacteroidota bacterium]